MSMCVSCEWCGASMQTSNRIELALLSLRYLTMFRTYFSAVICKGNTIHDVARMCQQCSYNPVMREYDRIYKLH